jgi:predicted  nucleic acid-binding Zn-ribbon protein
MSNSQGYEEVTLTDHGITVTKRFEEDEFPVPAIAFDFSSERDDGVFVRIQDSVPESVAVQDLGFHPEYGSEHWTVEGDTITFEREIEPESEYTTVYGIRATGTDDVAKFLTEPEIADVDPSPLDEGDSETADEGPPSVDDDIIPSIVSGETEAASSQGAPAQDESDEAAPSLELNEPDEEAVSGTPATSTESPDSDQTATEPTDTDRSEGLGSLISVLANEIREEQVDQEDLAVLREALQTTEGERKSGSISARVDRVQSDVADLRAYTDALEEFLDDNGTAEQLIDDFRGDVSELESSVEDVESLIEENTEELEAVTDEVGSLGEDVSELDEEVTEIGDDVEAVESNVAEFEDTVADLETAIATLEDQISEGDVADRIEAIEADIADLKEWQDLIRETFGG